MGAKTASAARGMRGPATIATGAITSVMMPGTAEFSGPPGISASMPTTTIAPMKMAAAL
jgi:hypothetical protein